LVKTTRDESADVIALRLVLAHWPDVPHVLRGIEAAWGSAVCDQVTAELSRRKTVLESEYQTLQAN